MALKGTLKDFGIADILQLIGQQQKTGILHLSCKAGEVRVFFSEGNIAKAEPSSRRKRELIGTMLVRAELISERELEEALQQQKRTSRKLGDVLIAQGVLGADRFREMVRLQTTETLYRLFSWQSGSYEFEQCQVEPDPELGPPLPAQAVLMEGFRMVDEWPLIRKKISNFQLRFERLVQAPRLEGEQGEGPAQPVLGGELGAAERKVFSLVSPDRDVQKLCDLSCLGEFETCKSLWNLSNLEFIRPLAASKRGGAAEESSPFLANLRAPLAVRVTGAALVLLGLGYLAFRADLGSAGLASASASTYSDPAAQRFVSRQQLSRIRAALEVYRAEKRGLPEKLEALAQEGLLAGEDLRYPWRDEYYYRRLDGGRFVLLPPLR